MKFAPALPPALLACLLAFAAGAREHPFPSPPPAVPAPAPPSVPPSVEAARPPGVTLCDAGEQVVFSCGLRSPAKYVSLCASKKLTRDEGYIQYRFGRPGRVELEFPRNRVGSQKQFRYEHVFRAQFDQTEISFEQGGFSYTLFDYYDGEQKPARRGAGVRVRAAGGNAAEITMRCGSRATAHYGDLTDAITDQ